VWAAWAASWVCRLGGVLLSQGWGFDGIFMALAAPAVLAALAILLNRRSL